MILDDNLTIPLNIQVYTVRSSDLGYMKKIFGDGKTEQRWQEEVAQKLSELNIDTLSMDNIKNIICENLPQKSSVIVKYAYPRRTSWPIRLYVEAPTSMELAYNIYLRYSSDSYEMLYTVAAEYFRTNFDLKIPRYVPAP